MFKRLKRFFNKPKTVTKSPRVANKNEYTGLSKVEIVTKACQEFDEFSITFTSKMIWKYLDGLLSFESVYKTMHYLKKKGVLRKVTILSSDDELSKYKLFYALNKMKND